MKEYEKLARHYMSDPHLQIGPRDPFIEAYIQGFLKAREMIANIIPKENWGGDWPVEKEMKESILEIGEKEV